LARLKASQFELLWSISLRLQWCRHEHPHKLSGPSC